MPTSDITASATVVDGFTTSETDNRGIVTAFTRRYTETGIVRTVTDGRGNASTTHTDIAGRPIAVTDAAGNTTTTTYCATSDNPSAVTNALGNTANYAYDIRNRKQRNTVRPSSRPCSPGMTRTALSASPPSA